MLDFALFFFCTFVHFVVGQQPKLFIADNVKGG